MKPEPHRAASRTAGGSGAQRFTWKAPLLPARKPCAQAAISAGLICSAPSPAMPPALATATPKATGEELAMGA